MSHLQLPRHGDPIAHAVVRCLLAELALAGFVPYGVRHSDVPEGQCEGVRPDLIVRRTFEIGWEIAGRLELGFAPTSHPKQPTQWVTINVNAQARRIIEDASTNDPGFVAAVERVQALCDPDRNVGYWTLSRVPVSL
jgi:hypothetical protein